MDEIHPRVLESGYITSSLVFSEELTIVEVTLVFCGFVAALIFGFKI